MNNINPDDQARIDAIEKALLARWPENRIAPTLERISALVDMLGSPQLTYPTIHVGGTNGKTTTSRMIDSLLFEMGLRTGRFTSPHLETYRERISINGQPIDPKALIFSYNDIAAYLDFIDSKFDNPISFFEAMTALAFAAFAEHPIDVGVIEVGMGGEWDATNVVDADVSVIMPIDLDHTEYLGSTISEIAKTKAGIWLAANAYRYGFVLRYPSGKTSITGYSFEPWHFRYVGIDVATAMHDQNIQTLEEFYGLPAAPGYLN